MKGTSRVSVPWEAHFPISDMLTQENYQTSEVCGDKVHA